MVNSDRDTIRTHIRALYEKETYAGSDVKFAKHVVTCLTALKWNRLFGGHSPLSKTNKAPRH